MGRGKSRYTLPKPLYKEIYWAMRDYPRKKQEYYAAINQSPSADGQPHGTGKSDPTEAAVERIWDIGSEIRAIEKALEHIDEGSRTNIFDHNVYGKPLPNVEGQSAKYWKLQNRKYVWYVAYYMGKVNK